MTDLDEFAFLWDGSQPGWRLRWINSQVWHVRVRFAPGGPTLGNIEMRSWVEQARAVGLETEVEVEERSVFLPIRDGEVLIIEIDELARRVGARMKAEGLPVDVIEED